MRMFDRKTPDIHVIADCDNNVDDEASINAKPKANAQENKRNLVNIVAQSSRPPEISGILAEQWPQVVLQDGPDRINNPVNKREDENVTEREARLGEMGGYHLAYAIRVYQAHVENEGHQVVVQDDRLEVKVNGDQEPCAKEWQ